MMTAIDLHTEIAHQLKELREKSKLQKVLDYIQNLKKGQDEEFSDVELAELDAEHEKAMQGDGTSYNWEEVKEMARKALKG
jgi:phosphoribosylanthranilate isomerase